MPSPIWKTGMIGIFAVVRTAPRASNLAGEHPGRKTQVSRDEASLLGDPVPHAARGGMLRQFTLPHEWAACQGPISEHLTHTRFSSALGHDGGRILPQLLPIAECRGTMERKRAYSDGDRHRLSNLDRAP